MKKAERMDEALKTYGTQLTSNELFPLIHEIFGMDLDQVPLLQASSQKARHVVDQELTQRQGNLTGKGIRQFINELFGVNLEALSALEGAGISLYAKRRWVIAEQADCFVVYSGDGDRITRVFITPVYKERTGRLSAPKAMVEAFLKMGYTANASHSSFYYESAEDAPVPDAFKGQTIGTLLQHMPQREVHN
ncbi:hypothetical protein CQS04_09500 [Chryseomicrobium excrementi]|uniref:Uncharacterized protein n=1 Tax=Chryseomicrobium excrementi TaxID=2041346 RepID=A0A2M9EY52_9BACL|nr:hypothetical protein [Chryseomicrobium excrementi]PJK16139.1 hypothetical protein CQS04_09500 [Chryseomicrobium excrementi]